MSKRTRTLSLVADVATDDTTAAAPADTGATDTAAELATDDATALDALAADAPASADVQATDTSDAGDAGALDATLVAYMLTIAGQYDSLAAASMHAGQYATLVRGTVCVVRADTGETIQCYTHKGRGKSSDTESTEPGLTREQRRWSTTTAGAIKLMLRPEGASGDEMRALTGWVVSAKHFAQFPRTFKVSIRIEPKTARTKTLYFAEPLDGFAPPPSDDDSSDLTIEELDAMLNATTGDVSDALDVDRLAAD